MATKDELEEELNERLGLDIEWSRMKKDDIETILNGLEDEDFIKKFVAQYANDKAGDMAQGQVENWEPGQFIQLAAQMQQGQANPVDMFF